MRKLGDLEYQPCADGRKHLVYQRDGLSRTLCGDLHPEVLPAVDNRVASMRDCMECSDIRHDRAAAGLVDLP